ncbi:hypothetical protein MINTM019_41480 [Mycobacterium paraintracellulare]|uniref:Uncharacterized protein n=1 Tax=Mycobacterium paraintracellulare TaxID=1138383 RepID=A0ABN6AHN9_9MYCO|nr:hypothetical protein MPRI_06690 [Mycobacterium paraintracellulare]BCO43077.1 hypothetical protein MINTM001_42160 [Mycobacterium paraintracellulare]BCO85522.1 hypothetical protein MINTM011_38570 [Mycobacterium paraintracellulare]BCP06692.1 hypothetical protein MINTM019_41480 [Mycobacterium paraintracellulare]BCP11773.1 hypothetical protein MINTM020_38710 [Mycobacterium paraintracellulare]
MRAIPGLLSTLRRSRIIGPPLPFAARTDIRQKYPPAKPFTRVLGLNAETTRHIVVAGRLVGWISRP